MCDPKDGREKIYQGHGQNRSIKIYNSGDIKIMHWETNPLRFVIQEV
jgi:hypothetical protein